MADPKSKPMMRSLGEFFGHIIKGVRTDPGQATNTVIRHETEEEDRGDMILRRTTVEEIEFKKGDARPPSETAPAPEQDPDRAP